MAGNLIGPDSEGWSVLGYGGIPLSAPTMAMLWENLVRQLDSVRAAGKSPAAVGAVSSESREQRLQNALEAIKDSGNDMMIESVKAALEGRQANLELPDLPIPGQTGMSGPEVYLSQISERFKPDR